MNLLMDKRPDSFRGDLGLLLGSFTRPSVSYPIVIETVFTDATEEFDQNTNGAIQKDAAPGWQEVSNEILIFYVLYEPEKRKDLGPMSLPKASSKRYNRTLLVNLGQFNAGVVEGIDYKLENIRWAIRRGCMAICRPTIRKLFIDPCGFPKIVGESAIYGVFERNEMTRNIPLNFQTSLIAPPVEIILHDIYNSNETYKDFEEGVIIGYCENFARMLHGPVYFMTIELFTEYTAQRFDDLPNVKIIVREEDWITQMKMDSFISVAYMDRERSQRGRVHETSYIPPKLLEIHLKGSFESSKPIILIGKALFYDRYAYKQGSLQDLKPFCLNDVSAGACIAATILAVTRLKLPLNLIGIIPMCSHIPRPAHDYTMHVKVPNTYEERLILQDALTYCHKFDPSLILTIATRTGYLRDTFEFTTSALYSYDSLANLFLKVSVQSGERFIQLPFLSEEDQTLFDDLVEEQDYCSITSSYLKDYALDKPWIHLDINNKAIFHMEKETEPYKLFEVTGAPTRTLIDFFEMYAKGMF